MEADCIYVTFDVDRTFPPQFPAVPTPQPGGGLTLAPAAAAWQCLLHCPRVIGGGLVEYNPQKDDAASSRAQTVFELIAWACGYQRLLGRSPHETAGA
jgi:arginase family enzyme